MEKRITYKQFMRAMRKEANAGLIVSMYNKQQGLAIAQDIKVNGITCNCERPVTYGVLTKKCHRCGYKLKTK